MNKPLSAHKAKPLVDRFNRQLKELEIYEAAELAQTQLKELLKQPNVWVVVGMSKWS